MLLEQIVRQLDAELIRLKSLRSVVAGLAKSPSLVRDLAPRLNRLLQAQPKSSAAAPPPKVRRESVLPETPPPAPTPAALSAVQTKAVRGRGRPRKTPAHLGTSGAETATRAQRPRRHAEPTALSKATSAGPVVMSAAALAREREIRQAAKAALSPEKVPEAAPEIRPEVFARELAARWLTSPSKA